MLLKKASQEISKRLGMPSVEWGSSTFPPQSMEHQVPIGAIV
jgi:hypothetical protein